MKFQPSRRDLLAAATTSGAAAILPSWALAQSGEVFVSWYPGMLGANYRKSYLETYAGSSDVKIIESWDNPRFTQMQANRNRPTLHVAVFLDVLVPIVTRSGIVTELDPALIPNLKDVNPKLPVSKLAVPANYGSWGIAYNAKHVKKPITSWADLLRDDLKGHVSSPNISYNSSVYTLDAMAALKGGGLRSPEAGLEAMHQIRRSGPGLWDQESIATGWLKTGEIWVTPYYSGNVLAMMKDPDLADMRFAIPSEGAYLVTMNVTRVKNDSAGEAPEKFINHMLGIEAQETWARVGMSRPSNVKASIPKEVAESVPDPDRLRKLDWDYFGANRTAIVDQWNRTVNR